MRRAIDILLLLLVAALIAIPAAKAVTREGHSTLSLGCGAPVSVDWYFPATAPKGLAWVQHGFGGTKLDMAGFARDFSTRTSTVVVVPTISSDLNNPCNLSTPALRSAVSNVLNTRTALQASAQAAGYAQPLPQPLLLVGHSLGGDLALVVASQTSPAGVVVLDGGSLDNGMAAAAAIHAITAPVWTVASPPGTPCKMGDLTPQLHRGLILTGGKHLDALGWGANFIGLLTCGFPAPQNVAAVQMVASSWANSMLDGTAFSYTGAPGTTIAIGAATGTVIP